MSPGAASMSRSAVPGTRRPADPPRDVWSVANDEPGIAELVARLTPLAPTLVVLEATGDLELPAAAALTVAHLPVALVTPWHVREFAGAGGQRARTDRLDAARLARCAQRVEPPVRPLPDAATQEVSAVLARRRQIPELLVAEHHRLRTARPVVRPRLEAQIALLRVDLTAVDGELAQQIEPRPIGRARDALLRSVPGVGPILATTLRAELPELGQGSGRTIAALVGGAPLNHDSGGRRGRATGATGDRGRSRAPVRAVRSRATLSAVQDTPVIRAVAQRPTAAGKPATVMLTAGRHKLPTILTAMLRHGEPWRTASVG